LKVKGIEHLDDGISDDVPEVVDAIAKSPMSRRLRSIALPGMSKMTFDHFIERFQVPLSDIGSQYWWTRDWLERLCCNRELASGLKRLSLPALEPCDGGVELLAHCPHFARLEHLCASAEPRPPAINPPRRPDHVRDAAIGDGPVDSEGGNRARATSLTRPNPVRNRS
jgi:hypothetical protein